MICLHILPYARNALPRRVGLAVRCENLGQDQCSNLPVRRHVVPWIASLDPGANGYMYLWRQIYKSWRQIVCAWLHTPQGVQKGIQMNIRIVEARCPGKVLVKVHRTELWAWMWTQNTHYFSERTKNEKIYGIWQFHIAICVLTYVQNCNN